MGMLQTLPEYLETDLATAQKFIARRTKNVQKMFHAVYGEQLDQVPDVSRLNLINQKNWEETLNAVKKAFVAKKFTLAAILELSLDEINVYLPRFNLSPKNYELLKKVFGQNYDQEYDLSELNLGEIPAYNQLILTLKNYLIQVNRQNSYDLTNQGNSILKVLKCSKEELVIFKQRILENRRKIRFAFCAVFGSNLDRPADILNLRSDQIADFEEGIKLGKQLILDYRADRKIAQENRKIIQSKIHKDQENLSQEKREDLTQILNCSKLEIPLLVARMSVMDEAYWALKKAFGENFAGSLNLDALNKQELKQYQKGIKILQKLKKQHDKEQSQLLINIVQFPWDEIIKVISHINPESKRYQILVRAHGANFEEKKNLRGMNETEKNIYYDTIAYLRRTLKKPAKKPHYLTEILNCSPEDLYEVLWNLKYNTKRYQVLVKMHGEKFDQAGDYGMLSQEERINYNTAINALRRKINNPTTQKNHFYLYQILRCKWEDLKVVLAKMDHNSDYYRILAKAYNNDFAGPRVNILSKEEEQIYDAAKKYLKEALRKEKARQNIKYLWEYVNCEENQLKTLLTSIPSNWSYYTLLQQAFGVNLDQKRNPDSEMNKLYYPINFLKMRYRQIFIEGKPLEEIVAKSTENLTLLEILNCTADELKIMLPYLNKNYLQALQTVFGPNLDQIKDTTKADIVTKRNQRNAIKRLINLYNQIFIAKKTIIMRRKDRAYLNDLIGCTYEELLELMPYLNENYTQVLHMIHGQNLDQYPSFPNKNKNFYTTYSLAKKKLREYYQEIFVQGNKNVIPQKSKCKALYLDEIIGCSPEELALLVKRLNPQTKGYQILIQVHGYSFMEPKNITGLDDNAKKIYNQTKTRLRKYYKTAKNFEVNSHSSKFAGKYLHEIVGCSLEEMQQILNENLLRKNTKYYRELQKIFGYNLDEIYAPITLTADEQASLYSGIKKIKSILPKLRKLPGPEILLPESVYLKNQTFLALVAYLPVRYQKIFYLYLVNDDISVIAQIMQMAKSDVQKCLKIIYSWFKQVEESYTACFQEKLPEVDNLTKTRHLKDKR